jgi:DNA-binding NtrC family response regulator
MEILKRYSFPGNVRELDGIVSSAVLLEQNPVIMPQNLPDHLRLGELAGEGLEAVKYRVIMKTLTECDGNQGKAAQKLGISRQTLNQLLRRYRERGMQE